MRIVIKPMGFALIVAAVLVLSALLLLPMGKGTQGKSKQVPISIASEDPEKWEYSELLPQAGSISVIPLTGGPAGNQKAVKLTVEKPDSSKAWHVQTFHVFTDSFPKGQNMTLRFWARSSVSKPVKVVFEELQEPYGKDLEQQIPTTPEWKQFTYDFTTTRDYLSQQSKVGFQVGELAGDFEFTGVELVQP